MSNTSTNFDKPHVRAFAEMLQKLMNEQSSHSSSCKTWILALIVGFLTISSRNPAIMPSFLLILMPIAIFMFLDAYYLGQEEHYKKIHREYLEQAKAGIYDSTYIINDSTVCETIRLTFSKLGSLSVLPFYVGLGALSVVLHFILNNPLP